MKEIRNPTVVQTADSTENVLVRDVIGNKEDAASKTVDTASIVALLRQMIADKVYQQQADAVLSQANPVSGTKYTVLDTVYNARITSIWTQITWATTQPTPLETHVTIDGVAMTFTKTDPVTATDYYAGIAPGKVATSQSQETTTTTGGAILLPNMLEGQSIKVEAEITWATTQPTPLECRVKYAKIP